MLRATDIFRTNEGQRLDFTRGAVDVVDLFNSGILPAINQLSADTGADDDAFDPFVDQAQQDVDRSAGFMNALSAGFDQQADNSQSRLGFQETGPEPVQSFQQPAPKPEQTQAAAPVPEQNSQNPAPEPVQASSEDGFDPASFTFEREARRDSQGRLRVYNPPSGDGGGSFEVAGITARYQPRESRELRALIGEGKSEEAESKAKEFYRRRAAPFTQYASQPGLQLQLADSVHHRGEGGLRRILQRATGSDNKDESELIRQLDADPQALAKFNDARVGYELDEVDRGRTSRKKFRKGLLNRFREANEAALQANQSTA